VSNRSQPCRWTPWKLETNNMNGMNRTDQGSTLQLNVTVRKGGQVAKFTPARVNPPARIAGRLCIVLVQGLMMAGPGKAADLPAFPGAVGQGAAASGGRGGDVYHVTSLADYGPGDSAVEGTLRHGIESAEGPRTIVFDVGGAIPLRRPLSIRKSRLTIAGQTAPGGITVWGYPLEITRASDVVLRYVRVRTGDFHARRSVADSAAPSAGDRGAGGDLDAGSANAVDVGRCQRVIVDHVSAAWGMDETLSVTLSRDVTVQHSIIAESLNNSFHPKGAHGYGTLIRGELTPADQEAGLGGYTFYGNLWAFHRARNPSIGGQQRLEPGQVESERRRTDVNLVNNVVYGWGDQATHRSDLGEVRINLVGNYYVNGPQSKSEHIFSEDNPARTLLYQQGNMQDADRDGQHDGKPVGRSADIRRTFRKFDSRDVFLGPTHGKPFSFFSTVAEYVFPAEEAYARVISSAGASLWRDTIDRRIVEAVVHRSGSLIDSQEMYRDANGMLAGIDDLPSQRRPEGFDTDGDGMPDEFETQHGLDPNQPADRNGTELSNAGYTNLEVYLNGLVEGRAG